MNIFGIILDATSLWLLAAVGACLAWFVPHRLSLSRERRSSFRLASGRFRSAVLTALSGLYPIPSDWPSNGTAIRDVLREKFPAIQAAAAEFRPHVPLLKRWLFDTAWRLYRLGKDGREIDQQDYSQYMPLSGSGIEKGEPYVHDNRLTYKANFKENVDRLLRFTSEN